MKISAKKICFCAVALALGFVLSYIKIFTMPWGGSVTLCSMLVISMIGYWYGTKMGIGASVIYGILQLIQDGGGYILSPVQVAFDYIFAFGALGLTGLFQNKKNGFRNGYVLAILLRAFMNTVGGYVFWMEYVPENFPKNLIMLYPIIYNYSFVLVEGIISLIMIKIPATQSALKYVNKMTKEE